MIFINEGETLSLGKRKKGCPCGHPFLDGKVMAVIQLSALLLELLLVLFQEQQELLPS